jgi:arylsulfatase A-like enzyme/Flp pilus assembly protein TadD
MRVRNRLTTNILRVDGFIKPMKKEFPSLLSLLLIFVLTPSFLYPQGAGEEGRLNVLLITIDTLRPDRLSCYSSPYLKTPNIDGLADKGILFSRAFAHTPTTLASHTNILLGLTPLYHGVRANADFVVPKEFLTLAGYLKGYGYSTGAIVGGYPLDSKFGLTQGFDTYDDHFAGPGQKKSPLLERKAEVVVSKALSWLETRQSPWFLWIHCYDPHDPYEPPAPFSVQYKKQPYDGEVAYVDFALAKLLSYLKENKLFGNTLIVLTGDHGESLGQHGELTHGYLAYNTTLWIPLIIVSPNLSLRKVDQYVSHIDIFPTVCDVLHLAKPPFLQGVSLLPAMEGKSLPRRPIYFESMYPYYQMGCAPLEGFIEGPEKFTESPLPELYSLETDFDELKNLAGQKELAGYRQKLRQIVKSLSNPKALQSEGRIDREALEKLKSLGYVSTLGPQESRREIFGPDDDVKAFLPFYNRSIEAMDLQKKGKGNEAIALLTRLIDERKSFAIAYYDLALVHYQMGRLSEAVNVLELGMERVPRDYALFFNCVSYLLAAGRYDEVIATIKRSKFQALETDPGIWINLGVAFSKKGDLDNARVAYEKALSLDDKSAMVYNNLATNYLQFCQKAKDEILFDRCIEYFKKAIELDPSYASPYDGLGSAYRLANNLDGAIFCWEKALQLNPDSDQTLYSLGLAYYDKGGTTKALDYLSRYQMRYGHLLPPGEREELENLIQKCRQKR